MSKLYAGKQTKKETVSCHPCSILPDSQINIVSVMKLWRQQGTGFFLSQQVGTSWIEGYQAGGSL